MRLLSQLTVLSSAIALTACAHNNTNPADPYENTNRKIHKFNMVFDKIILKPPAKLYKFIIPAPVRASVNNFYNNIYTIPVVANDLLQVEGHYAIKDTWRFLINSTFGVVGLFDIATKWGLPYHQNDLGLTFAKWGDKQSPYVVIPFLGPSTIRDSFGMAFEYTLFTPYSYLIGNDSKLVYSLFALRMVDLRSQMFDAEKLMDQALDDYSFLRDAYLQHRQFLINGENVEAGEGYVD